MIRIFSIWLTLLCGVASLSAEGPTFLPGLGQGTTEEPNQEHINGVIGVDTAGAILETLRNEEGAAIFMEDYHMKRIQEEGWKVIVTKVPNHVSSDGSWVFEAIEDYSGAQVKVGTQPGFTKAVQVGDPMTVWGRVWYGHAIGNSGYVSIDLATFEGREPPGWWAQNAADPLRGLSGAQKGLFVLLVLLFSIFLSHKVNRDSTY